MLYIEDRPKRPVARSSTYHMPELLREVWALPEGPGLSEVPLIVQRDSEGAFDWVCVAWRAREPFCEQSIHWRPLSCLGLAARSENAFRRLLGMQAKRVLEGTPPVFRESPASRRLSTASLSGGLTGC